MEPFVMVLACRPKSAQSGRAGREGPYQKWLKEQAARHFEGRARLQGPLYARVIWLRPSLASGETADVDNMLKPILDALVGIVYDDDGSVVRASVSRHGPGRLTFASSGQQAGTGQHLLEEAYNSAGARDILYLEVGPSAADTVVAGPVDGIVP